MSPRHLIRGALGLCTAALIAGCSQTPGTPTAGTGAYRPAYVLSVHPQAGDTVSSLEAKYHGRVVEFDGAAGYALIGLDAEAARQVNGRLSALGLTGVAEPNLNVFSAGGSMSVWSGGSMSVWSGGSMSVWSGGSMSVWSGGQYTPVPGNTAAFTQVNLSGAQSGAPRLGKGVKVAVIDTGLDLSHPAFVGAVDLVNAKDYVDGDSTPQEEGTLGTGAYGHGTAVASLVLQVAPAATILPIRVLGPDGSGDADDVASAIKYAADNGARIINLSLGSDVRVAAVQDAINYAANKTVFVTISAGNNNRSTLTYPAMDADGAGAVPDRILSVGSVDSTDRKASFSNYANPDLEIVAPGVSIYGAVPGGMLGAWSGTSMSAPLVAGGLALAAGQLTTVPGDLAKKLRDNASNSIYSVDSTYNNLLGKGRLDLTKFFTAAKIPNTP